VSQFGAALRLLVGVKSRHPELTVINGVITEAQSVAVPELFMPLVDTEHTQPISAGRVDCNR
jgi:hypothetical protein